MTPAARQGLAVGVATGTYGISFGALGVTSGLSVAQTSALSLLMFTGGSQFAYIGVLGGGGTGVAAVTSAALLGIRNGVYGLQLAPLFARRIRFSAAQFTIDESMAVSTAQDTDTERRTGFWAAGLAVYAFWNLTTLLGAVLGNVIGDPRHFGLDGAAVAAFAGLLCPRLAQLDAVASAAVAAVVAAALIPLTQPGVPVLGAALAAAILATWLGRRHVRHEAS